MIRVLVAPDKFKGSLSALGVAEAVAAGVRGVLGEVPADGRPGCEVVCLPMADGGEGTAACFVAAGFTPRTVTVTGPLGAPVDAPYHRRGRAAFVELADAAGLALCGSRRSPLDATTSGVGELVRAAIHDGADHVYVGVGGSASTDGGIGLLAALGGRFLDRDGYDLLPGGGGLDDLATVDLSGVRRSTEGVAFTLVADVDSALLGPTGAARVFAAQKGATAQDVDRLERGLARLVEVATATYGPAYREAAGRPGAGAAGGAGYALLAALGAEYRSGIEVVKELVGFDEYARSADVLVTGEGRVDEQTLRGKVVAGVAQTARTLDKRLLVVSGRCDLPADALQGLGVEGAVSLLELEPDVRTCMTDAPALLERAGALLAQRHLRSASTQAGVGVTG
ncbi:glycerate kinase [Cellulomonas wangsupingiae]|uniref:Glycerate kinase n=1 Tax=Cellulomonas wangsupingiae TaxID=2968085 RepID=A0ABY5K7W0_9CELL|nr:glycerate kinase [Cellulomonas wangsupingiae]MCC2334196.1 glycerate kinase [Cellulomonas wangsupingiae]UUI65874.1 glycerate kinase [Cellulomonas wangsupingiae]